jgi:hypothetical protein
MNCDETFVFTYTEEGKKIPSLSATPFFSFPGDRLAAHRDFAFPLLLHKVYDVFRHGNIVQGFRQFCAIAITPIEEFEHGTYFSFIFLSPVNQDERSARDRPSIVTRLIVKYEVETGSISQSAFWRQL